MSKYIKGEYYYEKWEVEELKNKIEELDKKLFKLQNDYDIVETERSVLEKERNAHFALGNESKTATIIMEAEVYNDIVKRTSCTKCALKNHCDFYNQEGYCSDFAPIKYGYNEEFNLADSLGINCSQCAYWDENKNFCNKKSRETEEDEFCYMFKERTGG